MIPAWTIPKAEKDFISEAAKVPGPGTYNTPKVEVNHEEFPKWTIKGKYPKDVKSTDPGPGQYGAPDYDSKGVSYSIKGRTGKENINENPGPGQYNIKSTKGNDGCTLGPKIPTKKRDENIPGPGKYQIPPTEVNHEKAPLWSIQGKPNIQVKSGNPGPGYYVNPDVKQPDRGVTMKGKKYEPDTEFDPVPGPGYYNVKAPRATNGVTIGERHDGKPINWDAPGPGKYNIPHAEVNHESFPKWTIKGKNPKHQKESGPGPGYYVNPHYDDNGVSYTMKGRNEKVVKDDNPGPGYYNVKNPKGPNGFSLGPKIPIKRHVEEVPGPGEYNAPPVELNKERFPQWTIPGKHDKENINQNPGPGHYQNPDIKQGDKGISMKGTKYVPKDELDPVPGPGQYNTRLPPSNTGVTIAGRYPQKDGDHWAPGPGNYNIPNVEINHEGFPKWSITGKPPSREIEIGPGPGQYRDPDYKNRGKAYTMQGRPIDELKDGNPGPGQYNVKKPRGPDGVTIKGKNKRKETINDNPGPGNYNIPPVEINHEKFPTWTIPSRNPEHPDDVGPGPGHYRYPDPNDKGKGVTMQGRHDKPIRDDNPGPGTYNTKAPPGHGGVTIGERNKIPGYENDVPGPGNYRVPNPDVNREKFPSWTINGRHSLERLDDPMPGPGHYANPDYPGKGKAYTMRGRTSLERINDIPGPGMYNIKGPKGNGITIGKKPQPTKTKGKTPGPGNYNIGTTLTQTGTKIGKGKRTEQKGLNVPGPGSYNDKRKGNPYKGRFSKSKRKYGQTNNVPGPGHYDVQPPRGREGPKIQNRYPDRNKDNVPGPAHYAFGTDRYKGPAFTIGERRRRRSLDHFPAPNHYLTDDRAVRNRSPKWVIGRSGRKAKSEYSSIGPGAYNHRSHISDGPSLSMGRRLKPLLGNDTPGPGQYNIEQKRPKSAKSRLSRAERLTTADNSLPGPGHYNLTGDDGRSISFTRSKRGAGTSTPKTPGPGSYHIPTWNDDTGRTILERHEQKLRDNYPGPGMYDISLRQPTGLSYSISGTNAIDYGLKERMNNPPPNWYDPNYKLVNERIPGGDIGKGKEKSRQTQYPGPGYYTVYDVNAKPKGCTMREKFDISHDPKYPGPGHYNGNYKTEAPAYTIGRGERIPEKLGDAPGPGFYKIVTELDKGVTIGKATKDIHHIDENVPGPGYYSNMYDRHSEGKGVTIGIRFPEADRDRFPGPGHYTSKDTETGPAYTIASKVREKRSKERENDRFYEVDKSYKATQAQSQNTTIGKSKRKDATKDKYPGPGHYIDKKLPKGPAITIGEKHPVPGDRSHENDKFYEVIDGLNAVSGKVPAAVIGTSTRVAFKPDKNPGPGYYKEKGFEKGPAYTMAAKHDDLKGKDNENDKYYDVQRGFDATRPDSKKAFIEKSQRKGEYQNPYPGPGAYDINIHGNLGGITMGAKLKPQEEGYRAPGPGAYKPQWDEVDINYTNDIKFGKANRFSEDKDTGYPGPGFYKIEGKLDKGPLIGTSQRSKFDTSDTPGPSYYDLPTMVPVIYSVNKPKVVP